MFFGFDREMACSRAELARWLTEITGEDHGMAGTGQARVPLSDGSLDIFTEDVPLSALGAVRLRRLRVRFVASPGAQDSALAWVKAFDRHTQRGGG